MYYIIFAFYQNWNFSEWSNRRKSFLAEGRNANTKRSREQIPSAARPAPISARQEDRISDGITQSVRLSVIWVQSENKGRRRK